MIYEKVAALCVEQKTTIAELERKAGLTKGSIAKWKNGMPLADNLAKVAAILGTTSEDLLGGDVA